MTDMRRENNAFQKKCESRFAIRIDEGTDDNDLALGTGNHQVCNLPPDCIITDAYVHVITVSDAATSSIAKLGTASAGSEVMSAAALHTATGETGTFTGQSLTGTGVTLWLGVVVTGAQTAVGEYYVVVEYLEPLKKTGEYTQIATI